MPDNKKYWGTKQKERSKRRLQYFIDYHYKGLRKGNHPKLRGENLARSILPGAIYVDLPSYDFLWKGKTIEVKAANKFKNKRWHFTITNTEQLGADYFLLVALDKNKLVATYFIPGEQITAKRTIAVYGNRFAEHKILAQIVR